MATVTWNILLEQQLQALSCFHYCSGPCLRILSGWDIHFFHCCSPNCLRLFVEQSVTPCILCYLVNAQLHMGVPWYPTFRTIFSSGNWTQQLMFPADNFCNSLKSGCASFCEKMRSAASFMGLLAQVKTFLLDGKNNLSLKLLQN